MEEQIKEMELDSWSRVTVRDNRAVVRPKIDKDKGYMTRTPILPMKNFDFDKTQGYREELSDTEVIYPLAAHNFDPSKVLSSRANLTKKSQIVAKAPTILVAWGQSFVVGIPPCPLPRANQ